MIYHKHFSERERKAPSSRHILKCLSSVCITALSAAYCSSYLSVCITAKNLHCYTDKEKASQFMTTGVAFPSLRIYILCQPHRPDCTGEGPSTVVVLYDCTQRQSSGHVKIIDSIFQSTEHSGQQWAVVSRSEQQWAVVSSSEQQWAVVSNSEQQ